MSSEREWKLEPRLVGIPNRDAAAGLLYNLPGVVMFEVVSLAFVLNTTADADDRRVVATVRDATDGIVWAGLAPAVQPASTEVVYSFAGDVPGTGSAALGIMTGPFVGARLPQNLGVGVTVLNAHAGDTLGVIRLLVHQLVPVG